MFLCRLMCSNDRIIKDSHYEEDRKDYYKDEYKDSDYEYEKPNPHKHCPKKEAHNHRFAKVTGEAIPYGCKDHYHEVDRHRRLISVRFDSESLAYARLSYRITLSFRIRAKSLFFSIMSKVLFLE